MLGTAAARILLTALGAAAAVAAAILPWTAAGTRGVRVGAPAMWDPSFTGSGPATIESSAGLVVLVLAGLAVVGGVLRTGWLTSLAGVLMLAAWLGFVATRARSSELGFGDLGDGTWLLLGAGLFCAVAGFLGARPRRAPAPPAGTPA